MKGKKRSHTEVETMPVSNTMVVSQSEEIAHMDLLKVILFSCLLFISMTLQTGRMSMILCGLCILSALPIGKGSFERMKQRFSIPVIGLLLFALMQGCAAIYSNFGQYAVTEYYKFIAAFAMVVILLTKFEKRHIRGLLWGFATVSSVIAIISIDMATSSVIYNLFNRLMQALDGSISIDITANIGRITGIYNNPNVLGSLLAIATLVSLYLVLTAQSRFTRFIGCILIGINAQVFFLGMSRGALLCFAVTLLVWLFIVGQEQRVKLFFLMLFSAVSVVLLSIPSMQKIGVETWIPNFLTVLTGVVLFALYEWLGLGVVRALEGHKKFLMGVIVAFLVVCGAYAVLAIQITGPYTFSADGSISRTFALAPGDYTVSGDWDGDPIVDVLVMQDTMGVNQEPVYTTLYRGPISEAAFTVGNDDAEYKMQIYGQEGMSLRSIVFSDGSKVGLSYPLLPSFLVERIQEGLRTSSSFTLRVQFDRDAWTLFKKSPLLGYGLGSTEGLYTSVQPFFYESKYVHNHILQVMTDMGVCGLAAFLMFMFGSLWLLIRRLKQEQDPMASMLVACWLMVNTHSLMEINFSVRGYLCFAFCILVLPVMLYGEPMTAKSAKIGGTAVVVCTELYLAVFGGFLLSKRMIDREIEEFSTTNTAEYMQMLEKCVRRDVFDHEQMQLNYVAANATAMNPLYNGNMMRYERELRNSGTYTACSGLARYYYLPRGEYKELFDCSREGLMQEASVSDAWNLQFTFYFTEVLPAMGVENMEQFIEGVQGTINFLEKHNQERQDKILLTEENQRMVNLLVLGIEEGIQLEGLYSLLMQV